MNLWFLLAGVAALVTFGVHTFVGGRYAATPLLAGRSLPRATVALNYLCWHIVTLHLGVMSATLFAAAAGWLGRDAVLIVVAMAASIFVVSLVAPTAVGLSPLRFPSTYLSVAIAALALPGL